MQVLKHVHPTAFCIVVFVHVHNAIFAHVFVQIKQNFDFGAHIQRLYFAQVG